MNLYPHVVFVHAGDDTIKLLERTKKHMEKCQREGKIVSVALSMHCVASGTYPKRYIENMMHFPMFPHRTYGAWLRALHPQAKPDEFGFINHMLEQANLVRNK